MKRLILPGWHGSEPDHWQRLWQHKDPDALVVEQDNWDHPELEAWLQRLHEAIQAHPDSLLVAHSLGVILVSHYAARHPQARIAGALLVAPGDADLHAPTNPPIASFAPVPRQRLPFPSTMVLSRNDPHMDFARGVELAQAWGSRIIDLGNAGHINVDSGFGPWPKGFELAHQLEDSIRNKE